MMNIDQLKKFCLDKQDELLEKYYGSLVFEAAIEQPETIGEYTKDLPLKIEAEFREFLEDLWKKYAPAELMGKPLVLDEQKLRRLMTEDDREGIDNAFEKATRQTLWERITNSNHEDVTFYKGLLHEYTRELLLTMRLDFLEEISGEYIKNKTFEDD